MQTMRVQTNGYCCTSGTKVDIALQ